MAVVTDLKLLQFPHLSIKVWCLSPSLFSQECHLFKASFFSWSIRIDQAAILHCCFPVTIFFSQNSHRRTGECGSGSGDHAWCNSKKKSWNQAATQVSYKITNKYLLAVRIIIFITTPGFCFMFCYERASIPNVTEAMLNEHFKDNGGVCLQVRWGQRGVLHLGSSRTVRSKINQAKQDKRDRIAHKGRMFECWDPETVMMQTSQTYSDKRGWFFSSSPFSHCGLPPQNLEIYYLDDVT